MAVLKLDNVEVGKTNWKPCSQQAWDQRQIKGILKAKHFSKINFWDFELGSVLRWKRLVS